MAFLNSRVLKEDNDIRRTKKSMEANADTHNVKKAVYKGEVFFVKGVSAEI